MEPKKQTLVRRIMIPLFKPYIHKSCGQLVQEVLESGQLTEGYYSDLFEKKFSKFIGNKNISLTNSCTSALHLAAIACDLKPGDEVITTAMTCMATNEPFYNMGLNLVFADVELETGNICPKSIENLITPKTKAIVIVHWAGQPCDIKTINKIAKKHKLKVIEDAAHALGSVYKGKKIGNHSDFVCFSFQAIKHLTCGDGGAIACKRKKDVDRIKKIRWFGLDRKFKGKSRWDQDIKESGYKYHMNNINASIGLKNLEVINHIIHQHVVNSDYYDSNINNQYVKKMDKPFETFSASWIYSMLVKDRKKFIKYMNKNGISADRVHVRNDTYSVFKNFKKQDTNLTIFDNQLVNIPVGWWLTKEEVNHIVKVVNNYE